MDIDKIYIQVRTLVEEVQDNLVIPNGRCIKRTADGEKLNRVIFGLDTMRKVVEDYYIQNEDSVS